MVLENPGEQTAGEAGPPPLKAAPSTPQSTGPLPLESSPEETQQLPGRPPHCPCPLLPQNPRKQCPLGPVSSAQTTDAQQAPRSPEPTVRLVALSQAWRGTGISSHWSRDLAPQPETPQRSRDS